MASVALAKRSVIPQFHRPSTQGPRPARTVPGLPVDPELARRLKRAAATLARSREQRDRLVVQAHAAGASLREIADLVGLTHVGVRRIINHADAVLGAADRTSRVRTRESAE